MNAKDTHADDIKDQNIEGESFGDFLKRHGLAQPDMMGYNEDDTKRDYIQGMKNPAEKLLDDEDD